MFGLANNSDINVLDQFFQELMGYVVQNENNTFNFNKTSGNANVNSLLAKWKTQIDELDGRNKDDMKVLGEMVITADKVEQGIYKCRVHSQTSNPMVNTLVHTVNKMIDSLDRDMTQLRTIVEQYSNDDFRNKVTIDPKIKADMLAVMTSVNSLGEALSNGAKTNLTNGQHLESNASTMSDSVNNLANKANQQAA
ncbi:MAG: methyl-accepting chemotaxis protein, partial [Campylobacterota bacterium]|nr:methyl-accepting chemotaxis protein [Campylobacterota bacterium]